MKPKHIKKLLMTEIKKITDNPQDYCTNPGSDFSRKRKLPMDKVLEGIIGMESGSLTNELIDLFDASTDVPTSSAFVQQRTKIKPQAFKKIFDGVSSKLRSEMNEKMPILAIDGSDLQIPTNPENINSFHPGKDGKNEHKALQEMVDQSEIPQALIIADRGYESFNSMAHIQEKG